MSHVYMKLVRHRESLEEDKRELERKVFILQGRIDALGVLIKLLADNDNATINRALDELAKVLLEQSN
jgi:hypothetical protein